MSDESLDVTTEDCRERQAKARTRVSLLPLRGIIALILFLLILQAQRFSLLALRGAFQLGNESVKIWSVRSASYLGGARARDFLEIASYDLSSDVEFAAKAEAAKHGLLLLNSENNGEIQYRIKSEREFLTGDFEGEEIDTVFRATNRKPFISFIGGNADAPVSPARRESDRAAGPLEEEKD